MVKLDDIGFYTLNDERAKNCSITSPMTRACFVITGRCNFHCPYCTGPVCNRDFTTEQVVSLLTDLRNNHRLGSCRFTGGEPTVHKGLLDMVKAAKTLGVPKIAISTNGSASPALYQDLVANGANDFSISADCQDLELAAKLSGRANMWEIVKSNIAMLSKIAYVIIGTTITEENVNQIPETLQFLSDLGVADIKLATATQFEKPIPIEILNQISHDILDHMPVLRYRIANYKRGREVRGLVEVRDCHKCLWVQDDIVMTPDGHYPCIVYPREHGSPIGQLKTVIEMRQDRLNWAMAKDTFEDSICKKYCMDIFADCNKRIEHFQGKKT